MKQQNVIKNANELEFAVFCIENVAAALNRDAGSIYRAVCGESDILKGYIVPGYEAVHTQSKEYIVNDIVEVMKERGVAI